MGDAAQTVRLKTRGVLKITGSEAEKLLNGILTVDLTRAAPDDSRYGALLSPQGKILFDFIIVRASSGGFYLECDKALLPDLLKRLTFYKLRADMQIEDVSQNHVVVADTSEAAARIPNAAATYGDPRLAALGSRAIILDKTPDHPSGFEGAPSLNGYEARRIVLGIPEGGLDFPYGDTFPHEALLDQLAGVDFDKGCYIGQEVVSRMLHRGTVRTRILKITARSGSLPESGTEILAAGRPIGRMGSSSGRHGLALIRLDRASAALSDGADITVRDAAVDIEKPDYARFKFPLAPAEAKARP